MMNISIRDQLYTCTWCIIFLYWNHD